MDRMVGVLLYCSLLFDLYYHLLHCVILYCIFLYCTVLYCTVLYCTVLYCTVLYCTVLYCTVLYCTVQAQYMIINALFLEVILILYHPSHIFSHFMQFPFFFFDFLGRAQELRKKQKDDLENRRLCNDLEAKRCNKKYQDLLAVRTSLPAFQMR